MRKYHRLTPEERYQIQALLTSGANFRQISRQLRRNPSTICREVRKGISESGKYEASLASEITEWFKREPHLQQRKIQGRIEKYVLKKIGCDWSPEQIAGRMRLEGLAPVSYVTIYRYLERDKALEGNLWKHLRVLRKKRKDRKVPHWKPAQQPIRGRTMIKDRPKVVESRTRLGDYERDTINGKDNGPVLLTIVDRTSRLLKLQWLPKKRAELVHRTTVQKLRNEPTKTITNDNGSEFIRHEKTAKALGVTIYFSRAFRSWERGTNENLNGLLRQYYPKRKQIPRPKPGHIRHLEYLLNTRPRKCLGYKTPLEVHSTLKRQVLR